MPDTEGELAYLGVTCDQLPFCDADLCGDFKVRKSDDKATRLGYALDHAARKGWRIEGRENPLTAKAYCPAHTLGVTYSGSEVTVTVIPDESPG